MSLKTHLMLIKKSGLQKVVWIGLIYGLIFGGMTGVFSTGFSVMSFIKGTVGNIAVYMEMFVIIIALVYIVTTCRVYLSMSMDRKEVVKNWTVMYLGSMLVFLIAQVIYYLFIVLVRGDNESLVGRLLNMSFDQLTPGNMFLYLCIVLIALSFGYMWFSTIGITYLLKGWQIGTSFILVSVGIFFLLLPSIIEVVRWGKYLWLALVIGIAGNVVMALIVRRGIMKVEVK